MLWKRLFKKLETKKARSGAVLGRSEAVLEDAGRSSSKMGSPRRRRAILEESGAAFFGRRGPLLRQSFRLCFAQRSFPVLPLRARRPAGCFCYTLPYERT